MDGRFEVRREELLAQARVSAEDWSETTARLETFVAPFVGVLEEAAQRRHFVEYSSGLLSNLERKTGEGIAYLPGQDRRQLQQFVGESSWQHSPLLVELARQVGQRIGEADGVIVFDPPCDLRQYGPSRRRGRSRSASRGNGAVGRARSTTVRWGSTGDMSRVWNTRW